MTVVITDAKYRMSLAAVRSLAECGHEIILTQTADCEKLIPAFYSKHASKTVIFNCASTEKEAYRKELVALLSSLDHPILLPVGAKTLELISERRDEFSKFCKFTVPEKSALDNANDKLAVTGTAQKLGIKTPHTYTSPDEVAEFPVIIKPRCGEKFGLKAQDRYHISHDRADFATNYDKMSQYGGAPIVQELITGVGVGVCLLMDNSGRAVSAICHRRIREYPYTGGPSTCCETFFDAALVKMSEMLLKELGFVGMAMVEYKMSGNISAENAYLLEINPRIWGSFPLTYVANATFADDYAKLSASQSIDHPLDNYDLGARMNFTLNDAVAVLDLIKRGKLKAAKEGIIDIFTGRAADGMKNKADPRPYRYYLRQKFFKF